MSELLQVENLSAGYGEAVVLQDVSFSLAEGQTLALLGRNGTGKTTLMDTLAGATRQHGGSMRLGGVSLNRLASHERAAAGIGWVPQERNIFKSLTVEENLRAAGSLLPAREVGAALSEVWSVFPELAERKRQKAGTMSGGQQQMLAIGHALMCRPTYLLIDEMSLGLAPLIVKRLGRVVRDLAAQGKGILLVEQFVEVALGLASHVVVLRKGAVRLSVHPDEVRADRARLTQAYL